MLGQRLTITAAAASAAAATTTKAKRVIQQFTLQNNFCFFLNINPYILVTALNL